MRSVTRRLHLVGVSVLSAAILVLSPAGPVSASAASLACSDSASATTGAMSATVVVLLNRDRVALGRAPLVPSSRLSAVAIERARRLAHVGVLSHAVAGGDIGVALRTCDVPSAFAGEAIGWTSLTLGRPAARYLYAMWKRSPEHWSLLTNPRFVVIGVGFASDPAEAGRTYSSVVLSATR